jgi:aspartate/methionine/tyrosine aminotransferase
VHWVIEGIPKAKYKLGFSEVLGDDETWAIVDWEPVMEELARHHGKAWESQAEVERRLPDILGVPEGEALLTQGTSEANSLVMHLLCEEGSTVVTDLPAYQPIPEVPKLYGARTVTVTRRMEDGWRLDLQQVQELVDGSTAAIFLTNLHNPTGAALRREELRALADIASDAGATLVVDEIFHPFVEDTMEVPPVREVAPEAVSTGSVSKAFVWAGTRIGWISGPRELVDAASRLRDLVEPTIAAPGIAAGPQVLDHWDELRDRARRIARAGMGVMGEWVDSRDDVSWVPPYAGIICFPRFEGVTDTVALAKRVLDEHGVMTSPGEFFGSPGHLRVGVGDPDIDNVKEGLNLVGKTLDSM